MTKREHYKFEPNLTALADAVRKGDWNRAEKILQASVKLDRVEYYLFGRQMPKILGLILDVLVMTPCSIIAEILGLVKIEEGESR